MTSKKNERSCSRREFLSLAAKGAGAVAVVLFSGDLALVSASSAVKGADLAIGGYDPTRHRYIYLVDIDKCIGCGACVRACSHENQVPKHFFRTWVERYEISRSGEVAIDSPDGALGGFEPRATGEDIGKAFFVPKLCNHCSNTPCVQLCPVGASFTSPDGVVLVDQERCIGCSYCVQACPYGSRFIHPETHTASKCTLCYHRLTRGMTTACVQNCPTGARKIGDALALGDEVAEILATRDVRVLKPELHTQPNCNYLGLSKEVR
ncbi:MAG: 4Fe-4S dicluster domain-containing protein [Candidatus Krumholzibacteriia bacterium]